jgi:SnoaL-like domain
VVLVSGAAGQFRDAVLARDMDAAEALLSEDVVFRSPAVFKPYQGRTATMVILRSVLRIAEDFRYTRSFTEDDGAGHVLVFEATVDGRGIEGADFLRIGDSGLIEDFRVMMRPLSGLNAVVARMGEVIPQTMAEMGLSQ